MCFPDVQIYYNLLWINNKTIMDNQHGNTCRDMVVYFVLVLYLEFKAINGLYSIVLSDT